MDSIGAEVSETQGLRQGSDVALDTVSTARGSGWVRRRPLSKYVSGF